MRLENNRILGTIGVAATIVGVGLLVNTYHQNSRFISNPHRIAAVSHSQQSEIYGSMARYTRQYKKNIEACQSQLNQLDSGRSPAASLAAGSSIQTTSSTSIRPDFGASLNSNASAFERDSATAQIRAGTEMNQIADRPFSLNEFLSGVGLIVIGVITSIVGFWDKVLARLTKSLGEKSA